MALPCLRVQQLSDPQNLVDEGLRADLMTPHRVRWEARSAAMREARDHVRATYAARRVAALARPVAKTMERCSTAGVLVECKCPGKRPVWYGCRQHWTCAVCRRQRTRRLRARLRKGIEARWAEARAAELPGWRTQHRLVLITMSVRHTGDLAADKRSISDGWRRFYKSMHAEHGKHHYSWVWEVTPGEDQLGHVHAHVAVIWPYIDWHDVRAKWDAACPESEHFSLVASTTPRRASKYLSKYLSKGVDTADFTPEMRARVVAAFYGARTVNTSAHFWLPVSSCLCGNCKAPVQVSRSVGESWLRALALGPGPRGPPSVAAPD